jgi:hypothetical protein
MKMSRKILLLIVVIGAIAASCKKVIEETPDPPAPTVSPYYIEFDGAKTSVDTCYDIYYEDLWNSYYHYYLLVPRTITYNNILYAYPFSSSSQFHL